MTAGVGYECHKLDNQTQVFFYEQDFYVLSNFSSFEVNVNFKKFPTSEHAYHYRKFSITDPELAERIRKAPSAHEAFQIAQTFKSMRRVDWDDVKANIMKEILIAKVQQHEYVRKKLLSTGDRELIEDSWRDDVWGWGPDQKGQNLLGKMWMEIREEVRQGMI